MTILPKMIGTLCVAMLTISTSQFSFAQKDEKSVVITKEPKINFYLEMIEIDAVEFADLMTAKFDNSDHTAMRNKMLDKVKAGKAKLLENQSMLMMPSSKGTTESIKELIYETEYEPGEYAEIPVKDAKDGEEEKDVLTKKEGVVLPPTPTAFETRNVGMNLEVESELDEKHEVIATEIRAELVKHAGNNVLGEWKTKYASETKIQMPSFYTLRINTRLMLKDGKFLLACTHTPEVDGKADTSRKVLVFIKVDVLKE